MAENDRLVDDIVRVNEATWRKVKPLLMRYLGGLFLWEVSFLIGLANRSRLPLWSLGLAAVPLTLVAGGAFLQVRSYTTSDRYRRRLAYIALLRCSERLGSLAGSNPTVRQVEDSSRELQRAVNSVALLKSGLRRRMTRRLPGGYIAVRERKVDSMTTALLSRMRQIENPRPEEIRQLQDDLCRAALRVHGRQEDDVSDLELPHEPTSQTRLFTRIVRGLGTAVRQSLPAIVTASVLALPAAVVAVIAHVHR